MPRLNWTFFLIFGSIGGIFLLFPELDLKISSLFYENGFDKHYLPYQIVYDGVRIITLLSSISLLILIILTFFGKVYAGLNRKNLIFLLLSFILAPGLVVNTVLKDHWGRARPAQIKEFGGKAEHRPPLIISHECKKNCSFVCGHASMGFAFLALAFLYRRRQKEIFCASVISGALIGLVRIAQGGHFFSDVIFSFFFTYITIRLLYYFMYRHSPESIAL